LPRQAVKSDIFCQNPQKKFKLFKRVEIGSVEASMDPPHTIAGKTTLCEGKTQASELDSHFHSGKLRLISTA
jgi:hypothetical protein